MSIAKAPMFYLSSMEVDQLHMCTPPAMHTCIFFQLSPPFVIAFSPIFVSCWSGGNGGCDIGIGFLCSHAHLWLSCGLNDSSPFLCSSRLLLIPSLPHAPVQTHSDLYLHDSLSIKFGSASFPMRHHLIYTFWFTPFPPYFTPMSSIPMLHKRNC